MKKTRDEVQRLVREFHQRLEALYGDRLKGVYLYGSYARGDARDDSDIDVAVVLAGEAPQERDGLPALYELASLLEAHAGLSRGLEKPVPARNLKEGGLTKAFPAEIKHWYIEPG